MSIPRAATGEPPGNGEGNNQSQHRHRLRNSRDELDGGRAVVTAPAVAELPDGTAAHFIMEARATSGRRWIEDMAASDLTVDGQTERTLEEIERVAAAINGAIDDTDPDRPEYELCYRAGDEAGETETDAWVASQRLEEGKPVQPRYHVTNGDRQLPDVVGQNATSKQETRKRILDAAREAIEAGTGEKDWEDWSVIATTNGDDAIAQMPVGNVIVSEGGTAPRTEASPFSRKRVDPRMDTDHASKRVR